MGELATNDVNVTKQTSFMQSLKA